MALDEFSESSATELSSSLSLSAPPVPTYVGPIEMSRALVSPPAAAGPKVSLAPTWTDALLEHLFAQGEEQLRELCQMGAAAEDIAASLQVMVSPLLLSFQLPY
jgi:hypothetical protein